MSCYSRMIPNVINSSLISSIMSVMEEIEWVPASSKLGSFEHKGYGVGCAEKRVPEPLKEICTLLSGYRKSEKSNLVVLTRFTPTTDQYSIKQSLPTRRNHTQVFSMFGQYEGGNYLIGGLDSWLRSGGVLVLDDQYPTYRGIGRIHSGTAYGISLQTANQ